MIEINQDPQTQRMAWGQKVNSEFRVEAANLAKKFGWGRNKLNWLMACMAFESAQTLCPSTKNGAGSGAVGLIQFMPSTAKALGTSTEELIHMSANMQLMYVGKYFEPYAKKIESISDMYMAILMPKYVGAKEDAVLFSHGIAYRQNSGLDINHDGIITKEEAASMVKAKLVLGLNSQYASLFPSNI